MISFISSSTLHSFWHPFFVLERRQRNDVEVEKNESKCNTKMLTLLVVDPIVNDEQTRSLSGMAFGHGNQITLES